MLSLSPSELCTLTSNVSVGVAKHNQQHTAGMRYILSPLSGIIGVRYLITPVSAHTPLMRYRCSDGYAPGSGDGIRPPPPPPSPSAAKNSGWPRLVTQYKSTAGSEMSVTSSRNWHTEHTWKHDGNNDETNLYMCIEWRVLSTL